MYNPASIVDLRRNPSFVVPSPIHTRGSSLSTRTSSLDEKQIAPVSDSFSAKTFDFQRNSSRFTLSETPPNLLKLEASVNCDSCNRMSEKVSALEEHILALESRQSGFEEEVLTLMKSISLDIQDVRNRNTISQRGSSDPDTSREAISSACLALEHLIASAKDTTDTASRLHS